MELAVGAGNILLALSADHAAMPLPEYRSLIEHKPARRIMVHSEIYPRLAELEKQLQKELKTSEQIIMSNAFLNYAAAARAGIDSVTLEQRVRQEALKIDGIADVVFRREILSDRVPANRYLGYYQRGYYPPRGKDFIIRPCEYCLFTTSTTGTSHGTPYPYDTKVRIVFWGTGVLGKQLSRLVNGGWAVMRLDPPVNTETNLPTKPTIRYVGIPGFLVTALLFGLAPALRASKPDVHEILKEGTTRSSPGLPRQRLQKALVVVQVALASVLLVGGGLLLQSLYRLMTRDPGFDPRHVLTVRLHRGGAGAADPERELAFWRELFTRLKKLPGVVSVAAPFPMPLETSSWTCPFFVEGQPLIGYPKKPPLWFKFGKALTSAVLKRK